MIKSCLCSFFYWFIGGILAGYISDKTNCSGITVVVMLFGAGPMVSFCFI